jgi:hypothetical protein
MKIVDIANEIWYTELDETSDTSIAAIAFWLRSNVGKLNESIGTDYSVHETTLEIVDEDGVEIGLSETAILKEMYLIYWYGRQAKNFLGVSSANILLEVSSDGATVKTVNRNEIAKSYLILLKEARVELQSLINGYVFGKSTPRHVYGDDTESHIPSRSDSRYRGL